jgi:hypothetical protein
MVGGEASSAGCPTEQRLSGEPQSGLWICVCDSSIVIFVTYVLGGFDRKKDE